MIDRKTVDTGDVAAAEMRGEIKTMVARVEGVAALFSAEVNGLRNQIKSLDDRFRGVEESIHGVATMAKRAIEQQSEHREATLRELHDLERQCDEASIRLEDRLRAIEVRRTQPLGLTKNQKTIIIAIIGALASALGFGGGTVARIASDHAHEHKETGGAP